MKLQGLTRVEKLKLIGMCIRAATAITGGSLVISEGHPYIALSILATGAVANEIVSFIKERENEFLLEEARSKHQTDQS